MDTKHRVVARKSIHVDGTTGEGHAAVIFRALANDTRVAILRYLGDRVVAVNQIAKDMGLPSSTATMHVTVLERAGLLHTELRPASRGLQKVCARTYDELVFDLPRGAARRTHDAVDLQMPIGGYSDFVVEPTCGLVSATGLIGFMDDPSAFYEPDRLNGAAALVPGGLRGISVSESRAARCPRRVPAADRGDLQRGAAPRPRLAERHHGLDQRSAARRLDVPVRLRRPARTADPVVVGGKGLAVRRAQALARDEAGNDDRRDQPLDASTSHRSDLRTGTRSSYASASSQTPQNVGGLNLFGRGFGNYPQDLGFRLEYRSGRTET